MGEGVETGNSPVNDCCSDNDNCVDNAVVHSEFPLCLCWNQWSTSEVHISWFQDKWPTQRQQLGRDGTTKIIKFLDNEDPFEVNSATQHSLDAMYCYTWFGEYWHAAQLEQKIIDKMTDHRVSDFVFKKSNHVVAPASTYPVKATSDTASVNPLLLLQQCIFVGYDSRELVDVLKCELCVYPTTLFEATGTMLQSGKSA